MSHSLSQRRGLRYIALLALICISSFTAPLPSIFAQDATPQLIEAEADVVQRDGTWTAQNSTAASGGVYLYTSGGKDDALTLSFNGTRVEIIYVSSPALGTLAVEIDGTVVRTVITTSEQTSFNQRTVVDYLTDGNHTLKVYGQAGSLVAVDAFVATPAVADTSVVNDVPSAPNAPCTPVTHIQRVSVDSNGAEADGYSNTPALSGDGRYVVFQSDATNLIANDTNEDGDIFVHDRQTCQTTRVSVLSDGSQADDYSDTPAVSDDGNVIAFVSHATNFVAGDTNGYTDIYAHDRTTGQTTRISISTGGAQGNNNSYYPAVSGDGRYVIFESSATTLAIGDANARTDVFLHDRQTGQTTLASVSSAGAQGNEDSYQPMMAANGQYFGFYSYASNLVTDDTNDSDDVFVRNMQTGETIRVSVASDGTQGNNRSYDPKISATGRYVVFSSSATNLVAGDTNGMPDIFWHDRDADVDGLYDEAGAITTRRVSVASAGAQTNGWSRYGSVSNDGRYVGFESDATNLVAGDTNGRGDSFVYDTQTNQQVRVSVSAYGAQGDDTSYRAFLSGNGQFFTFRAYAHNLVPGDTTHATDIFVSGNPLLLAPNNLSATAASSSQINLTWVDNSSDETEFRIERSPDGTTGWTEIGTAPANSTSYNNTGLTGSTAYYYRVRDYRAGDSRFSAYSNTANATTQAGAPCTPVDYTYRADVDNSGTQSNAASTAPSISGDGRYVTFISNASNLVANDTNGFTDVFVHDRQTCVTTRVSVASDGTQADNASYEPAVISGDGRYVAFTSIANNLVPGDTVINPSEIFVHDRQTGQTTRVSVTSAGVPGNNSSVYPSLSGDGRYVGFISYASNLVANDTNGASDIFDGSDAFVHDRQTGETTRVSVASDGSQGNDAAYYSALSVDGRYVAFTSEASNLVANDTNGFTDVFVHDRQTAQTTRVSVASNGTQGNNSNLYPALSADGRYVTFESLASNLVANDTNFRRDVFVHDRQTAQTTRVSVASNGAQGNLFAFYPKISADGRYVSFTSDSTNLVTNDTNGVIDAFVHDRQTGHTTRVSVAFDGAQSNNASSHPAVISADGRYITFASTGSNLVTNDTNGVADIFVLALPPTAPSNLTATAFSTSQINLTWADNSSDEAEFRIERSPNGTNGWTQITTVAANSTSYQDTGLAAGTIYYYRVRAYRASDPQVSGYSNNANATTQAAPSLPNAPSGLTANAVSPSQINLTWVDNSSDETEFRLEQSPDGTTGWTQIAAPVANATSYNVTGLTANTPYYFRILAYRAGDAQSSVYSNVANATTPQNPPIAPSNLAAASVISTTRIDLTWTDNSSDETEFRLEQSPDGTTGWTQITAPAANATSYNVTGLTPNTPYYFRVLAYRAGDAQSSAYSNVANATTLPIVPAPINVAGAATSMWRINLTWTDNSTYEDNFYIERSLNGSTGWIEIATLPANTTSYGDIPLLCSTTYHYRVRASRTVDAYYSLYSVSANTITNTCPPQSSLALFRADNNSTTQFNTLQNPPSAGTSATFTLAPSAAANGGQWVMGDWNGDGVRTPGVYTNGAFRYTNDTGATHSTWTAIWIGLSGRPAVAGRFSNAVNHDCIGVVDSAEFPPYGTGFALYYACDLTSGPTPSISFQWLSTVLPTHQGHSGQHQFLAGDFNNDGVDSIAVRRGPFIAYTNVPPAIDHAENTLAQYIGTPSTNDYGVFVSGDWDNNGADSFGLFYQNGSFYRRNDLDWNTGNYTLQQLGTPLGNAPIQATSWQ